ncbi:MAG TPA: anti-sigma factor [Bryobacteraceae bacterium]|nr:anti-sigma factor [Bryobacteraceae bacterium]
MSDNEDLRDLYELYVLGLLDQPDRARVEQALRDGSQKARDRLRRAMENNAMLLASVPPVEPPARLRSRVLASVGVRHKSWGMLGFWAAATASLLLASVYFGAQKIRQDSQLASVRAELQQVLSQTANTNAELARARHVLNFLNAPETRVVTFGPKDPKPPRGRVLLHPNRGVLLIASNLPPAPNGKIYEMWIIPKGGLKPIPAGLFQADEVGNAIHLRPGTVGMNATIAVTLEPESGSGQPTTTPLFAAAL